MNIYVRDRFGNTIPAADLSSADFPYLFKVEYRKLRDDIGLSNDYQRMDSDASIYQALAAGACKPKAIAGG